MPLPARARALMARHLGLVTRAQLLAMGCGPATIDGWLRRGVLEPVQRGVYRMSGGYVPPNQAALALVYRCGPGARAGPLLSLALHAIEGFPMPALLDVVLPAPRHIRPAAVTAYVASGPLPRIDCARAGGVPCLTVTRALVALDGAVPGKLLRVGFDDGRRRKLTSVPLLRRRATALLPRAGARRVLRLLEEGAYDPESEGERVLRPFLASLGLELEWGLTGVVPGRRLDAFYRPGLVEFEYDGRAHHVLPTDRDADGLRDLEIAEREMLTLRITSGMIRDAPDETLARIARICELRRRKLAGSDIAGCA